MTVPSVLEGKIFIIWLLTASNEVNHSCCDWKGPAQLGNFLVQTRIFDGLLQQGGFVSAMIPMARKAKAPRTKTTISTMPMTSQAPSNFLFSFRAPRISYKKKLYWQGYIKSGPVFFNSNSSCIKVLAVHFLKDCLMLKCLVRVLDTSFLNIQLFTNAAFKN